MGWVLAGACFLCDWWVRGRLNADLPHLLMRWHRLAFRAWWRWRSRRRGGRTPIDRELIDLISRISLENPLWGADGFKTMS